MTKTYDDRCDCKPRYCFSPFAILRWVQIIVGLIVAGCLTTVCGNKNCLVLTNEFAESNLAGQMFVMIGVAVAIMVTLTFMILYSMNAHRVSPAGVGALERALTVVVIVGYIVAAAVECYYAAVAHRSEYDYLSRQGPIQNQWIVAAVFAFINTALYIVDFVIQLSPNYPNRYTLV